MFFQTLSDYSATDRAKKIAESARESSLKFCITTTTAIEECQNRCPGPNKKRIRTEYSEFKSILNDIFGSKLTEKSCYLDECQAYGPDKKETSDWKELKEIDCSKIYEEQNKGLIAGYSANEFKDCEPDGEIRYRSCRKIIGKVNDWDRYENRVTDEWTNYESETFNCLCHVCEGNRWVRKTTGCKDIREHNSDEDDISASDAQILIRDHPYP